MAALKSIKTSYISSIARIKSSLVNHQEKILAKQISATAVSAGGNCTHPHNNNKNSIRWSIINFDSFNLISDTATAVMININKTTAISEDTNRLFTNAKLTTATENANNIE